MSTRFALISAILLNSNGASKAAELAPAPRVARATLVVTPEVAAKLRLVAFQAAREGDVKTLRAYLAAGQPVNEPNARGDTLLIVAAYAKQVEAVELLLAQPTIAVDARNKMGLTALAAAAFKGDAKIIKALVKAKADVNAANGSGQTALMFAALAGKLEAVNALIEAGANVSAADRSGNTPLSLARTQGAEDVVRRLEENGRKP